MSALRYAVPDNAEMCATVEKTLELRLCLCQIPAAREQLAQGLRRDGERRADVCTTRTSSGKALGFMIPFLSNNDGISVLVTLLNQLGEQMEETAKKLELSTANLTGKVSDADELYKVWSYICSSFYI